MTPVAAGQANHGAARTVVTRATATPQQGRTEASTDSSSTGFSNERTRLVGNRDGLLAEIIVISVRFSRVIVAGMRSTLARVSSVVTPLGWAMVGVVALALSWGYLAGWTELVAVGYTGVVLLLIAVLYLVGRSAYRISLELPHTRVAVGDTASGMLAVTNPARYRVFGTRVEVPVGAGIAEIPLPGLAASATFEHEFVIPTARRGRLAVGPVRTIRADPLGLVRRELTWTDMSEFFVHPRTIAIPSTSTGLIRDLEGNATRDITTSDVSFHALREYARGDERRNIHWKSTAKTGTYMVRQFEETRRSHLVIALSLAAKEYANDDEFEMAVSVAGSLGVRAIREVRNVSVVASATTPEFAKRKVYAVRALSTLSPTRLLDELSVVEREDSALGLLDIARVTADQVSGISVAFLVCGSVPTPGELRAASTRFSAGVEVIAVVCDPDSVPGLRRVAGLSVLTIGYLEDLQKSLARAAAT